MKNTGLSPLDLSGLAFTQGISFAFTNETILGPGQYLVLARNAVQFAAKYPDVSLHGLYAGKLDNNGETISLITALGATVFSVTYDNAAPWPAEADNSGLSLQRMNFTLAATNAVSWIAASPTPGGPLPPELLDSDGDGLPDGWEIAHGFNPAINDASEDADYDGLSNYQEFLAGTDPRRADDGLRIESLCTTLSPGGLAVMLGFPARSNKTYSIAYRNSSDGGGWTNLLNVTSHPTNRFITATNVLAPGASSRFFRLATPRLP